MPWVSLGCHCYHGSPWGFHGSPWGFPRESRNAVGIGNYRFWFLWVPAFPVVSVEISAGSHGNCRFCLWGHIGSRSSRGIACPMVLDSTGMILHQASKPGGRLLLYIHLAKLMDSHGTPHGNSRRTPWEIRTDNSAGFHGNVMNHFVLSVGSSGSDWEYPRYNTGHCEFPWDIPRVPVGCTTGPY